MIKPEELTEMKGENGIIIRDKNEYRKSVSRRRDVIMNWKNRCSLAILAVESQKEISYAMPVRNMLYDALAYTDQMKVIWNEMPEEERPKKYTDEFFSRFRKTDSIFPVITLVLYYGASGDWDGSQCIYDMFGENLSKEQKEKLRNYVSDYKINLVEMQKMQNLEVFKSDLKETIGMLQCRDSGEKLEEYVKANKEALSRLDLEARQVISEVMNVMNLEKYVRTENGKEVVDVCKAVQELIEKGRGAGREAEREEGIRILISTSKEYGIPEETIKVKLVEKYKLTEQEADEKYDMVLKEENDYKI